MSIDLIYRADTGSALINTNGPRTIYRVDRDRYRFGDRSQSGRIIHEHHIQQLCSRRHSLVFSQFTFPRIHDTNNFCVREDYQ